MLPRAKTFSLVLAFFAFWIVTISAQAQSTNSDDCGNGSNAPGDDKYIGVCNLENTVSNFTYDTDFSLQGSILFSIRSCGLRGIFQTGCVDPASYRIQIENNLAIGGNFILAGSDSNIPVTLSFSRNSSSPEQLSPNVSSGIYAGSVDQTNSSLNISILGIDPNLTPGTYSNTFYFSLEQEPHCWWFLCTDTNLEPIAFIVELKIEPRIRISGLDDKEIDANPSGLTEVQQSFCVYSQGGTSFGITAGSDNGNGSFLLAGSFDQIEYETWIENLSAGGLERLTEGQPSAQIWPGSLWDKCTTGGDNMQISIRIQQNALSNAMESSYSDTLTLTVELD